jgi:hypothetical protein
MNGRSIAKQVAARLNSDPGLGPDARRRVMDEAGATSADPKTKTVAFADGSALVEREYQVFDKGHDVTVHTDPDAFAQQKVLRGDRVAQHYDPIREATHYATRMADGTVVYAPIKGRK